MLRKLKRIGKACLPMKLYSLLCYPLLIDIYFPMFFRCHVVQIALICLFVCYLPPLPLPTKQNEKEKVLIECHALLLPCCLRQTQKGYSMQPFLLDESQQGCARLPGLQVSGSLAEGVTFSPCSITLAWVVSTRSSPCVSRSFLVWLSMPWWICSKSFSVIVAVYKKKHIIWNVIKIISSQDLRLKLRQQHWKAVNM